ncbi:hypothetical protein PCH_Pc22g06990 [Penicillium rubens Wisconsin 54-1255]|uniref:Uncharacterized protein n=1 Tax=Penicillium rubens (strain ATCC 28089 / DSM 1075 / NRRL 1951 / Wisconsin 54-1255) TaxID=500485 RepID=B6HQI6_PENRW|nr:hypothetical protein PCH_Pc22g06990 [Penicillium rubens Wisconsin 54-1255]
MTFVFFTGKWTGPPMAHSVNCSISSWTILNAIIYWDNKAPIYMVSLAEQYRQSTKTNPSKSIGITPYSVLSLENIILQIGLPRIARTNQRYLIAHSSQWGVPVHSGPPCAENGQYMGARLD